MAFTSPITGNQGTVPPPSAPGISGVLPGQQSVNATRILSLTQFSKELKTRDIQNIFLDYEDDRGGYRIKWLDDTGCLIVFNDAITAKRAFLHLLANPHPHLLPFTTPEGENTVPILAPYTAEDSPQVIASVQNRPRSRSIASGGVGSSPAHNRRLSNSSGMHARMSSSASGNSMNGLAAGANASGGARSFGRGSMSQNQMQSIIDEAMSAPSESAANGPNSPPSPTAAAAGGAASAAVNTNGGAIDWHAYQQQQSGRSRGGSGTFSSSPGIASPDRGMQGGGAISPNRMRRPVNRA